MHACDASWLLDPVTLIYTSRASTAEPSLELTGGYHVDLTSKIKVDPPTLDITNKITDSLRFYITFELNVHIITLSRSSIVLNITIV